MSPRPRPRALPLLAALAAAGALLAHAAAPAAPAALAQSRPRCTDPVGTIEGLVLLADGRPAAGAEVRAVLPTLAGIGEPVAAVATADAEGRYRLEALCPTDYRVRASLLTSAGILAGAHDADGDGIADAVVLSVDAPAATAIDIVLGRVPLPPPTAPPPTATPVPAPTRVPAPACAITDGEIRGTVRDQDGNPVEGAEIHFRGRTAAGRAPARTVSAADGTYAIPDLCEGSYYVVASKVLADGTALSGAHPDMVELAPDARLRTGIDIVLGLSTTRATPTPTPATFPTAPPRVPPTAVPDPRPGSACRVVGSATGSARLATGEPVEGAMVQLVAQAASGASAGVMAVSLRDGTWTAPRVCAGAYTVVATRITGAQALVGVLDADGDALPDVVRIDETTPALSGLDLVLRDVLAPAPSPFQRRGQVWPSRAGAR